MKRHAPNLASAAWLKNPSLQKLLRAIAGTGKEARVVGGAVRNALLGVPVSDIDIATTLTSQAVLRMAAANGFATHETGIDHGTITVVVDQQPFEVTTLRRDVATDGRRATVEFTDDWREDALRRDFTINALYCDISGNIFDYTSGYDDILTHKVRFVGTPSQRIREDYLRILRFFRFTAHYGKGVPDAAGLAACAPARRNLSKLSIERVTQETLKLLAAPNPLGVLKVMAKNDILKNIFAHATDWRTLGRLPVDPMLRLFVLAKSPLNLHAKLRLSNQQQVRLKLLHDAPTLSPRQTPAELQRILYQIGPQVFADAASLSLAKSRAKIDDPSWTALNNLPSRWQRPKFPINGQDLKAIGIAPGPAMGQILLALEQMWLAKDFNLRADELLVCAKSMEKTK